MAQQQMPYLKLMALDKLRVGDWSNTDLMAAGGLKITDPLDPTRVIGGFTLTDNHTFKIVNNDNTPSIAAKRVTSDAWGIRFSFDADVKNVSDFPSAKSLFIGVRVITDKRLVNTVIATAYTGKRAISYKATLEPGVSYYIELGATITISDPTPIVKINEVEVTGVISESSATQKYHIGVDTTGRVAEIGTVVYYSDPYIHVSHESRPTGFMGDIDIRTSDMALVDDGGWSVLSGEAELKPIDAINAASTGPTTPAVALSRSGSVSQIKCDLTSIGNNPDLVGVCFNVITFRDPSSSYDTWVRTGTSYQETSQQFVTTVRIKPADKFSPLVTQNTSIPIVVQGYIAGSVSKVKPKLIDVSIKSIKV